MAEAFHSGQAYPVFDALIGKTEAWLAGRLPAVGGIEAGTVAARLVQRLVDLALLPYMAICAHRLQSGNSPVTPPAEPDINCSGLRFHGLSGEVTIAPRLLLRSILEFLAHWFHLLGAILLGAVPFTQQWKGAATLVFGIGAESLFQNGSDARFVDYCRHGPIRPLQDANRMIVQSTRPPAAKPESAIVYHPYPVHALVKGTRLGIAGRLALLAGHLVAPFIFMRAVLQAPLLALLARDVAYLPALRVINRYGLIRHIVQTNSAYISQPLWMRKSQACTFELHMVFYSQNVFAHVYRSDIGVSSLPGYRHIAADEIWVWTPGFKEYLEKLGLGSHIHVVGPILWYLWKPKKSPAEKPLQVVVFDVTPVRDELALELGLIGNYYSASNMTLFIEDVLSVCNEMSLVLKRPIKVQLKHKRGHSALHDPGYIDRIHQLSNLKTGGLEVVEASADMYAMLETADCAIVVPYSSPAYVADHVAVPAVYYDPTQTLCATYEKTARISFAAGRDELLAETGRLLSARHSMTAAASDH